MQKQGPGIQCHAIEVGIWQAQSSYLFDQTSLIREKLYSKLETLLITNEKYLQQFKKVEYGLKLIKTVEKVSQGMPKESQKYLKSVQEYPKSITKVSQK